MWLEKELLRLYNSLHNLLSWKEAELSAQTPVLLQHISEKIANCLFLPIRATSASHLDPGSTQGFGLLKEAGKISVVFVKGLI